MVWHGEVPEQDRVQAAKDAIGGPVPQSALEEARAQIARSKAKMGQADE